MYVWGGVAIGFAAAVVCYFAVVAKGMLGYDDSLDAFGVHGVGGFVGAVLTGLFCASAVNSSAGESPFSYKYQRSRVATLDGDKGELAAAQAKVKDADAGVKTAEEAAAKAPADGKEAADKGVADAKTAQTAGGGRRRSSGQGIEGPQGED